MAQLEPLGGGVCDRSAWRHEQLSVAVALAASTHHSAQQIGASRSQKTATRAKEVEEHVTRRLGPPSGERPGVLAEPGPQRSDRTMRHSVGDGLPPLVLPSRRRALLTALEATRKRS